MPEPKKEGLIAAFVRALRNFGKKGDVEERAETAKEGAEEINKMLPEDISGRVAVLRKRKQIQDIDKMLEDANR